MTNLTAEAAEFQKLLADWRAFKRKYGLNFEMVSQHASQLPPGWPPINPPLRLSVPSIGPKSKLKELYAATKNVPLLGWLARLFVLCLNFKRAEHAQEELLVDALASIEMRLCALERRVSPESRPNG